MIRFYTDHKHCYFYTCASEMLSEHAFWRLLKNEIWTHKLSDHSSSMAMKVTKSACQPFSEGRNQIVHKFSWITAFWEQQQLTYCFFLCFLPPTPHLWMLKTFLSSSIFCIYECYRKMLINIVFFCLCLCRLGNLGVFA